MNKLLSLRAGSTLRRLIGVGIFLLLFWFWPGTLHSAQAKTIYVNGSAGGTNDGTSWANAYPKLQDALANAGAGDQIWVAKGVYYPDEGNAQLNNSPNATFTLKNGVALYGGFAGTETQLTQRSWQRNPTVLSGDLEQNDKGKNTIGIVTSNPITNLVGTNAYHVLSSFAVTASASLDGFSITAGKAVSITAPAAWGGGLYSTGGNPTLANLIFWGNAAGFGGGATLEDGGPALTNVTFMYNEAGEGGGLALIFAHPVLTNLLFRGNLAQSGGGGLAIRDFSHAELSNVRIFNNVAVGDGGGMSIITSDAELTNVMFWGNRGGSGGALYNLNSDPVLINTTLGGNYATKGGGGIFNTDSNPTLINTIVWGNDSPSDPQIHNDNSTPTITYSLLQGLNPAGTGNLDGANAANDPQFVQPIVASSAPTATGNYSLQTTSPAIDLGNSSANSRSTDVFQGPRLLGGSIDLGAAEAPLTCPAGGVLYVKQGGAGKQNGRSWTDAFAYLQNALQVTAPCEIWVAKGIYYPDEGNGQINNKTDSIFRLWRAIPLYGGFVGTESSRDQRNWQSNVTVLSGDLEQNDTGKDADGVVTSDPITNVVGANAMQVVWLSGGDATVQLDGFTITAATSRGLVSNASTVTLNNLIFRGNLEGGLYNPTNSNLTLTNVTFANNSGDTGGGLVNYGTLMLSNATFQNNDAQFDGGGLANLGNLTLATVTFQGNRAEFGGGLYSAGNLTLTTAITFTNNLAKESGGGLYLTNISHATLTNVTLSGNHAKEQFGGGMYIWDSTVLLTNATFNQNEANSRGGGMFIQTSAVTLTHVILNNNDVLNQNGGTGSGGGLYVSDSDLELTDAELRHNHASTYAGGMSVSGGNAQVNNVTIADNISDGSGGGMYIFGQTTSTRLTNVTITGNQAQNNGGGLANEGEQTLTNVALTGNRAEVGGGIRNFGDQTLINVTVAGNQADEGSGIFNNEYNLVLNNTIVWGNGANADPQLANRFDGTLTIDHSLIEGQNPPGVGNLDGANLANNPNFVAPQAASSAPTSAGDYRRQPNSPASDRGKGAVNATTTDLAGQPRKQGVAIDLGAYENSQIVVNLNGLEVGEPDGTATFSITLTSQPTANVTITLTSSDAGECSVPAAVQLTPGNWQTGVIVTVSAVDDTVLDGPQPCTIQTAAASSDAAYDGVSGPDVNVTVKDNEQPGVVVNPLSFTLAEPNEAGSVLVKLVAQPAAVVTITLASNDPTACSVTPASVTLDATNWQTGVLVMVSAVDDAIASGDRTCVVATSLTSSTSALFNGLVVDDVTVTVTDNDVAGITASPAASKVSEPNGTAHFTLQLKSQPTAVVTLTLTSDEPAFCSVPASVTLQPADWHTGATVTVTAVDDHFQNGDHPCTIDVRSSSSDLNYQGQQVDVPVTVADDDTTQVLVEPTVLEVAEPNETANFTVKLTSQPTATVTVNLSSSDTSECSVPASVQLNATNWQSGVAVTVSAVDDALADSVQSCVITTAVSSSDTAYDGRDADDVQVKVVDNETPGLVVKPPQLTISTLNGSAFFTITLTTLPTATVDITLTNDDPANCSVPDAVALNAGNWQSGAAIQVTALVAGPKSCSVHLATSSGATGYDGLNRDVTVTILNPNEILTVQKSSDGSGVVTSSPAGINCGAACSFAFARNSQVTLTATPDAGSTFGGWSGACSGSDTCRVTLDRAHTVTAAFNKVIPPPQTLTVSKAGAGSGAIKSSPVGINCSATCAESFAKDTVVMLTATPAAGSTFAGWSGACSGTTICQVTLDAAKNVVATFTLIPPTSQTLSVTKAGTGTGKVTSSPAGIDCGATCSAAFAPNSQVTLTATPDAGSTFAGWSGAGCSGTDTCQVTLDAAKSVIADFNKVGTVTQALTVSKAGSGGGTVKSTPVGIDCGTACSFGFAQDTLVTLTATPAAGSTFDGWSGGECSGIGTCVVKMDGTKTVTATFTTVTPAPPTLTVNKAGTGTGKVTSSPAGIDCAATCSFTFTQGAAITLTVTLDAGSTFAGWSGACSGIDTCQLTMDGAKTVTATFTSQSLNQGQKVYLPLVNR